MGWKKLRLEKDEEYETRKMNLMGASKHNNEESTCYAILAYALFRTVGNNQKKAGEKKDMGEEIAQHTRNAVEGHAKSAQVNKNRWQEVAASSGVWACILQ